MSNNFKRTNRNYKENFEKTISRIRNLCKHFDEGMIEYDVIIATQVRVLLYDSAHCSSIMTQLQNRSLLPNKNLIDFVNFSSDLEESLNNSITNFTRTYLCRYRLEVKPNVASGVLHPSPIIENPFDDLYGFKFDDWWNKTILYLPNPIDKRLSRKDVVLLLSNKDGGAHLDKNIPPDLLLLQENQLRRLEIQTNNALYEVEGKEMFSAIIRTIAEEILVSSELWSKH